MFDAIAHVFGYVLKFWLGIVGNYGVALILFTITIKAIILPLTVKQQKSTEKTQELQPKLNELQEKYKDDKEKLSQEYQKFMSENKFNPFGGCLIAIVQLFILLGVFYVVASPLTFMEKFDKDTIKVELEKAIIKEDFSGDESAYLLEIQKMISNNTSGEAVSEVKTKEIISGEISQSGEISGEIINIVLKESNVSTVDEKTLKEYRNKYLESYMASNRYHELKIMINSDKYDMNFLGINLGDITAQNMGDWKLWIFPILTTIFYYLSMWMITRKQKKTQNKMKDANGNEIEMPNMMAMNFMMPLLSGWISFSVPQGMGLYWFMNSLLQIIIQFITEKVTTKKKEDANEEIVLKAQDPIKEEMSNSKKKKIEKNKKKK